MRLTNGYHMRLRHGHMRIGTQSPSGRVTDSIGHTRFTYGLSNILRSHYSLSARTKVHQYFESL